MCHNGARAIAACGTVTAMDYGYARVSTTQQDLERQLNALAKAGVNPNRIYSDKKSGATTDRPGLIDVFDRLRPGDVLVVYTLDRLGRTVRDVLNQIHDLREAGIVAAAGHGGLTTNGSMATSAYATRPMRTLR